MYLEPEIRSEDSFSVFGFTSAYPTGVPVVVERLGQIDTGSGRPSVFLGKGRLDAGLSGSPLLNRRTLGVAGLITHSAGQDGGAAVTLNEILAEAPQLMRLNHSAHSKNASWLRFLPTDPFCDYVQRIDRVLDSPPPGLLSRGTVSRYWVDAGVTPLNSQSGSEAEQVNLMRRAICLAAIKSCGKQGLSLQQESELHFLIDKIKCLTGRQPPIRAVARDALPLEQALRAATTKDNLVKLRVEGGPGTGKSTLLQWVGLGALRSPVSVGLQSSALPCPVTARNLLKSDGPPSRWLRVALEQDDRFGVDLPDGFVQTWSRERDATWIVLVDNCEEVPTSEQPTLRSRVEALSLERWHVVASARPGYCAANEWPGFADFGIAELTSTTRHSCAQRWFQDRQDQFTELLNSVEPALLVNMLGLTLLAESWSGPDSEPRRGIADLCDVVYEKLLARVGLSLPSDLATCATELFQLTVVEAKASGFDQQSVCRAMERYLRSELEVPRLKASKQAQLVVRVVNQVSGLFGDGSSVGLPSRVVDYCVARALINQDLRSRTKEALLDAAIEGRPALVGILQMVVAFTVRFGSPQCSALVAGFLDEGNWPHRLLVAQGVADGLEIREDLARTLCEQIGDEILKNAVDGQCARVLAPKVVPADLPYQLLLALRRLRHHRMLRPVGEKYLQQLAAIAASGDSWRARRDLEVLQGPPISLGDIDFEGD